MFLKDLSFLMLQSNTHYAGHGNCHATGLSHIAHDTLAAPNKTNLLGNLIDYKETLGSLWQIKK